MPEGFAEEAGDCDNQEPLANPGAAEVCDGIDNNCDGISISIMEPLLC